METKICRYCGRKFEPEHMNMSYCSDDCRKQMRALRHREWNDAVYGDTDFIPEINFVAWEDRFDEADLLTQRSMLQRTLGVSYGVLQTCSAEKFKEMVDKAKAIHHEEDLKMLEGIAKRNEEIRKKNEENKPKRRRKQSWSL